MAIWNFGSVNIDHVYRVPHLPVAGETLAALGYTRGLGGKGANQSIAAALAGASVHHIGTVGTGAEDAVAGMVAAGVDCRHLRQVEAATGHAVIWVDPAGENVIVIHPGANAAQDTSALAAALDAAAPGDLLLMQNETPKQPEAATMARARGLRLVYSAAPFAVEAVRAVLGDVAILIMNAVEAAQLQQALGCGLMSLPVEAVVVTRGAEGAEWIAPGQPVLRVPAAPVAAVDTTGAGDCFTGNLAAALDRGLPPEQAMRFATAAAGLQVARPGAAAAMPGRTEVDAMLAGAVRSG